MGIILSCGTVGSGTDFNCGVGCGCEIRSHLVWAAFALLPGGQGTHLPCHRMLLPVHLGGGGFLGSGAGLGLGMQVPRSSIMLGGHAQRWPFQRFGARQAGGTHWRPSHR